MNHKNEFYSSTNNLKSIFAAISGNFVEWFDFALYLFLAPVLAKQFFPDCGPLALMGTLTVYAVSFFFRPFGAVIFGHIGDRYGHSIALRLSLSGLAVLSIVISLLPNYQSIGSLATIVLCLSRILQGICLGGEFAGNMVYLGESSRIEKRALNTSLTNNASNFGILTAAASTALLSFLMTESHFELYGFRLLFFFGGIIGIIGFTFRSDLKETVEFKEIRKKLNVPVWAVLTRYRSSFLSLFMVLIISALGSYALIGYMSTFLQTILAYTLSEATRYETLFIAITLMLVPFFERYADKYTPRRMLKWACLAYLLLSIPCYYLFYTFEDPLFLLPLVAAYSAEQSCVPALMMEYFPTEVRYTGISLTYNSCMAFVGGISPLLCQFLMGSWNLSYAVPYLLFLGALVAIMALKESKIKIYQNITKRVY